MDDAERRGKLRGGQMLAQDKCPPLGLPTSYPAECQSMTAGMRAGWLFQKQKQLKSASAGQKPRNSLAGALTKTANPCYRAYIEDRLANLPTCDYFSQTSIL